MALALDTINARLLYRLGLLEAPLVGDYQAAEEPRDPSPWARDR